MNWLVAGAVFLTTFLADFAWSRYTLAVTLHKAQAAAIWSAAIVVFGAVNVVAYAHDWRMFAFAAVGAYSGTFMAVRFRQ